MKLSLKEHRDGSAKVMLGNVIWKEKPVRKRFGQQEWQFSIEILRMREIEAVIRNRHGFGIPDPHGSDDTDTCHAYLRAVALTPGAQSLVSWSAVWAPWADQTTIDLIAGQGKNRKRMIKADAIARLLFVTLAERNLLGLKTIGACDIDKETRDAQAKVGKRERDRARQERKRRAAGRQDRGSYQAASLAVLKPWGVDGVSRRTWERRRVASVSRVEEITKSDTLASKQILAPEHPSIQNDQAREAGLIAGLGDHPPAEIQEAGPHGTSDRRVA